MKNTKITTLIIGALMASMIFTGCGGNKEANSAPAPQSSTTHADTSNKVARHTSTDKKVVTLNGEVKALEGPIFLTSVGQSADVSMLDALMKKVGAEYKFNATAKSADLAGVKTVIIAAGASTKGLGAAGISVDDEKVRAKEILEYCKKEKITVVMAHLGGAARRGKLSDEFSDMVMESSNNIIMVEDGNSDGRFSDFAKDKNIPITMLNTIADSIETLKTMFGK